MESNERRLHYLTRAKEEPDTDNCHYLDSDEYDLGGVPAGRHGAAGGLRGDPGRLVTAGRRHCLRTALPGQERGARGPHAVGVPRAVQQQLLRAHALPARLLLRGPPPLPGAGVGGHDSGRRRLVGAHAEGTPLPAEAFLPAAPVPHHRGAPATALAEPPGLVAQLRRTCRGAETASGLRQALRSDKRRL